jgi:hypothetical protein
MILRPDFVTASIIQNARPTGSDLAVLGAEVIDFDETRLLRRARPRSTAVALAPSAG